MAENMTENMTANWQTIRRVAGYYPRVLRLIWAASPQYTLLAMLTSIISALANPAQIWLSQIIIDTILLTIQSHVPGSTVAWSVLFFPVGMLIGVLILKEAGERISGAVETLLRFQVLHHANYLLLEKASQLDIAFFESPAFYDRLSRSQNDLPRMLNLVMLTTSFVGQLFALIVTLGLVAQLHPLAMFLMLAVSLPQLVVSSQFAMNFFQLLNRNTPAIRMAEYLASLLTSREAVKEIRLFGLQQLFLARFRQFWQAYFEDTKQVEIDYERKSIFYLILSAIGTGVVWVFAIIQAVLGRITIGELTLAIQAVEGVRSSLGSLFLNIGMFYEHGLFIGNFFELLDLEPEAVEGALTRKSLPQSSQSIEHQGIEFRNVTFSYPGSDRPILQNVSFTIPPETSVAVVGENGAGKTTLVKLLARFYDPTEGEILLNGRDLRAYPVDELQRNIGVIFQDFVRYELTALENIGFGQLAQFDDIVRVKQAAEKGGAASVIDKLPNHYQTMLGKTFDNSVDLSGGEWQKMALSRAFMRDAPILILDEPTAALDAKAEYDIYKRFAELTASKTTFFISHRFSTVRMAQHILVLDDGRLVEEGSHDTLMALGGQYAEMFTIQAERYL
ncbi:MAG: ABC transporter ATP-binding protein [Chloroflexota bacterium]